MGDGRGWGGGRIEKTEDLTIWIRRIVTGEGLGGGGGGGGCGSLERQKIRQYESDGSLPGGGEAGGGGGNR